MIRKNRLNKIYLIIFFLLSISLITFFILRALEKNIDLYLTPSDVKAADFNQPDDFKLGGMVKVGSLEKLEGLEISFIVTDFESEMTYLPTYVSRSNGGKGFVEICKKFLDFD